MMNIRIFCPIICLSCYRKGKRIFREKRRSSITAAFFDKVAGGTGAEVGSI